MQIMWTAALLVSCLLVLCGATVPYGVESLEDLYRLQQLYQMSDMRNDPYLPLLPLDDIDSRSDDAMDPADEEAALWGSDDSLYSSPLFSGAQARDQEHLEHSALQGLHAVSGTLSACAPCYAIFTPG